MASVADAKSSVSVFPSSTGLSCAECGLTPAVCRCLKCECLMCLKCFEEVHKMSKYMQKHTYELLKPSNRHRNCIEHVDRPVEYFCVEDLTPVCSHCVVMGKHKGHEVSLLQDETQKLNEDMANLMEEARISMEDTERLMVSTNALIVNSQSYERISIERLQKYYEQICAALKSRQEKLERDFLAASAERLQMLKELHTVNAARKKDIETVIADVNCIEKSEIVFHAKLLQRLKEVVKAKEPVPGKDLLCLVQLDALKLLDDFVIQNVVEIDKLKKVPSLESLPCKGVESSNKSVSESKLCAKPLDQPVTGSLAFGDTRFLSPPPVRRMNFPSSLGSGDVATASVLPEVPKSFSSRQNAYEEFHFRPESLSRCSVPENTSFSPKNVHNVLASQTKSDVSSKTPSIDVTTLKNHSQSNSLVGRTKSVPPGFKKLPSPDDISRSWRNGVKTMDSSQSSDVGNQNLISSSFTGRMELVKISHVLHPGLFWVHFNKDLETLNRLSQEIQDYGNGNHGHNKIQSTKDIEEGDLILAKFRDGVWYRAEITSKYESADECRLSVYSIDYGKDDVVSLDDVLLMRPNFLKIPQLMCLCCLSDAKPVAGDEWSDKAANMFRQMVTGVPMMMQVMRQCPKMLYIRLSWPLKEGVSDDQLVYVSDAMVFLGLASYTDSEVKLPNVERRLASRFIKPIIPECGRVVPVAITEVFSPHLFYVQILQTERSYFLEMMEEIQIFYGGTASDALRLFLPFVGMSCLVNCKKRGEWRRAEVTELLDNGHAKIFYVDFGDVEVVDILQIRALLDKFVILPAQANRCILADVELFGGSVDDAASSSLRDIGVEPVYMNIKELLSGPVLSVYLSQDPEFKSECLFNFILIANGLAVASNKQPEILKSDSNGCLLSSSPVSLQDRLNRTKPDRKEKSISKPVPVASTKETTSSKPLDSFCADLPKKCVTAKYTANSQKVRVSHFVSPNEFYIQIATSKNLTRLHDLMQELDSEYKRRSFDPNRKWNIGDECVARFSIDKCWYRAKIIGINDDRMDILFRDYGYRDFLRGYDLRPVDGRFMQHAWFSICCHLVGLQSSTPGGRWSTEVCETLKKMLLEKVCYVDIKDFLAEGSLPTDIFFMETVKGSALEPDNSVCISLTEWILENGLGQTPGSVVDNSGLNEEDGNSRGSVGVVEGKTSSTLDLEEPVINKSVDLNVSSSSISTNSSGTRTDYRAPDYPGTKSFLLVVTYVDEDLCIYGQESKTDLSLLSNLMDKVQSHYHCTMPVSSSHVWTLGQPVASQFTDDNLFYRAKIVGFSDLGIEVQYIDYGNREVVRKERLRLMNEAFLLVPIQCLSCCLYNVHPLSQNGKWPSDVIRTVNELLSNKVCKVTVRSEDTLKSRISVDLKLPDGQDLATLLKENKVATNGEFAGGSDSSSTDDLCVHPITKRLPDRIAASPYLQMTLPLVGDLLNVVVTEIEYPNVLYIQHVPMDNSESQASKGINANLKRLLELSVEYSSDINNYEWLSNTEILPGTACVAQYSADSCWYRAEIICLESAEDETKVGVRFVDYGSCNFLSADKLRVIPADHIELPVQSWRCSLHGLGVLSDDESYVTDVVQKLTRLFAGKSLVAVVKCVLPDGVLDIDLFDRNLFLESGTSCALIYQSLLDEGLFDVSSSNEQSIIIESQEYIDEEEPTPM